MAQWPAPPNYVPDVPALLTTMARDHNTFGLSQLAADSAPRHETWDIRHDFFRLIVGDSFSDRIVFWNNRSRLPTYIGRSLTSLIVPPAALDDETFLTALVEFLKSRNHIRQSSGSYQIELTSTSIPFTELQAHAARLNVADTFNSYHATPQSSIDDTPGPQALNNTSHNLSSGQSFGAQLVWQEFPTNGRVTTPPVLTPKMLDGVAIPQATDELWAVDIRLQRHNNSTRFSNVRHEWKLPRRLRLHGAFIKPYVNSSSSAYRVPRTTASGALSFYIRLNEIPPNITLPDDRTALTHAILHGRDWPSFQQYSGISPSQYYEHVQPSDKGRYLLGTLSLFGGLQNTGRVLLHRFWKKVFDELGAAVGTERKEEILNELRKKLKSQRLDTAEEWERLASVVAKEAQRVRIPRRTVGLDRLQEQLRTHMDRECRALEAQKIENTAKWLSNATDSLEESIQGLCTRSVLYQGYEWRCHRCFHYNWSGVRHLQPVLTCEICQTESALPVNQPWDFRLNEFLCEAIKEHGVLALIWCLLQLEDRARKSFYFLEPTTLFVAHPQRPQSSVPPNEADLICVVDGKVYLCEVKSSARINSLGSFVQVAKRMRPDVALLAVMDSPSQKLSNKLEELKNELEPDGIQVELLTFSENHLNGTAYLPIIELSGTRDQGSTD